MAKLKIKIEITSFTEIMQKTEKFSLMEIIGKEDNGNPLKLQAINQTARDLDNYVKVGLSVEFDVEITGREYNGNIYQNLNIVGYKIDETQQIEVIEPGTPQSEEDEDLPF